MSSVIFFGKILTPRARVLAFVSACDSGRIFVLGQERVCLNQIVSSLLGELPDLRGEHPEDGPLLQGEGAEVPVELPAGLVPVEDDPVHPAAVLLHRYLRELHQEAGADAATPILLGDEDVLQVEGGLPREGGVGVVV